ncbi:MAG: ATP-grasp domain-containing protein, partial [Prolixibacteraceae bacterium]
DNKTAKQLNLSKHIPFVNEEDFVALAKKEATPLIYANSENPINWIVKNLSFTPLPEYIQNFKDKVKFRKLIQEIFPDFFFKEVDFENLETVNPDTLPMPCILKPSVGFFSIGVKVINHKTEWEEAVEDLKRQITTLGKNYPSEVIDTKTFIVEDIIPGDEYAVDAYFDKDGKPVILNILKHLFSSGADVSDRVYITSADIIGQNHENFREFLSKLGKLSKLRQFPMHIEFRVDDKGNINPIEVNPMRFAGWCVTDIALYAYGINVYEYYFEQKKPDWNTILKNMNSDIFSMVVADLPKDIPVQQIKGVDYKSFESYFEHPLEQRPIDYKTHGVFAFQFARTSKKNMKMLDDILHSDLKEYLIWQE